MKCYLGDVLKIIISIVLLILNKLHGYTPIISVGEHKKLGDRYHLRVVVGTLPGCDT